MKPLKITEKLKNFYTKNKKIIFTVLRITISAALIVYLVFFRAGFKDFRSFYNILKTINIPFLLASSSIHIFGIWISVIRWQILLKTQQVRLPQRFLTGSFLIGSFFNNLLPTSIGGDIFRSIDIANKAKISVGKSASIIVIERFSGVVSAASYAIIALFLGFRTVGGTSYDIPVISFFIVSILISFLILNPSILRLEKAMEKIKFLSRIREKLKEIYHTFLSFKEHKLALFKVMACSFALQFGIIIHYFLAAKSMGIELSFATYFFIVPIVATIAMLPLTIGGAGIRENSLVFLMVALGAPESESTVVSLLIFGNLITIGIIGAIIYIIRPFLTRTHKKPAEQIEEILEDGSLIEITGEETGNRSNKEKKYE